MKPIGLIATAAVAIGASRFAFRARLPDDYDSIGFVRALDRFDLTQFQPHFPGYPVFIALGRIAHAAIPSALDSATVISALASAITAAALWLVTCKLASDGAAWITMGLYAGAFLPWYLGGAALSDATAGALAMVTFLALLERNLFLSGVLVGLMLGVRASYFPLALSWGALVILFRRDQLALALGGAVLGIVGWLVPFLWIVGGLNTLLELGRVHVRGHFSTWGGAVTTRPALGLRLFSFARDLLFDGLAPRLWAVLALAAGSLTALFKPGLPSAPSRSARIVTLVLVLPYGLWALFGQNVIDQPRHLLPLVLLLMIGMGLLLSRVKWLGLAAVAVTLVASFPIARAHAQTKSAAAQAADYVVANYPNKDVAVFGGRAVRTFHQLTAVPAYERTWLSEVDVTLERLDVLPDHVLITSEVETDRRRLKKVQSRAKFCREAALDRAQPCLEISEYSILGSAR